MVSWQKSPILRCSKLHPINLAKSLCLVSIWYIQPHSHCSTQPLTNRCKWRSTVSVFFFTVRDQVMCICDSVLASILGSKAGNSLMKCLSRIGDIAEHTLQLVTPYTLGKKVQIYLQCQLKWQWFLWAKMLACDAALGKRLLCSTIIHSRRFYSPHFLYCGTVLLHRYIGSMVIYFALKHFRPYIRRIGVCLWFYRIESCCSFGIEYC